MNDELNSTDPDPIEDTEGHAARGKMITPAGEDTEGHAMRPGRIEPAEDTEGHAMRPGRTEPGGEAEGFAFRRTDKDRAFQDDTEGHAASRKF